MPNTTPMSMQTAVNLAHALCQAIAERSDVRVLFLKGPTAGEQGLRSTAHVSGDVDVLCTPADLPAMEAGLRARGWHLRPMSTAAREFTTHSVTYIHSDWPCDVDVHTTFPGFFASPSAVFEALWERRELHRFAGVELNTPDRVAQFLILLLHGLRSPSLTRNKHEIESAATFYRSALSVEDRVALRELVNATGSAEPTAEFFAGVGDPFELPSTPSESYIMWRLLTSPSRTENWMLRVSRSHGMTKVRTLFRAVVPSRADMLADHPKSGAGLPELLAAHLRRLVRATRLAPHALRSVLAARRQLRRLARQTDTDRAPARPSLADAPPSATALPDQQPLAPVMAPPGQAESAQYPRTTIARNAVEWAEPEGTLFILPLTTLAQNPLALRDTAADLWSLLEEHGPQIAGLTAAASAHWAISEETIRPEIEHFVLDLTRAGALASR